MKCPHCLVEFHDEPKDMVIGTDADGDWGLVVHMCPSCNRLVVEMSKGQIIPTGMSQSYFHPGDSWLVRPKCPSRNPLSSDVPQDIAADYKEACLVLPDSPKASAALSRRCLQHLLHTAATVKPGNLADEIQQVIDSRTLPTHLGESLDAIRNIGNFAAHPLKSTHLGEIVDVEQGEAEWNLDVLESLFDFYFVQPAILRKKRDALNKKLADLGKPPMK